MYNMFNLYLLFELRFCVFVYTAVKYVLFIPSPWTTFLCVCILQLNMFYLYLLFERPYVIVYLNMICFAFCLNDIFSVCYFHSSTLLSLNMERYIQFMPKYAHLIGKIIYTPSIRNILYTHLIGNILYTHYLGTLYTLI